MGGVFGPISSDQQRLARDRHIVQASHCIDYMHHALHWAPVISDIWMRRNKASHGVAVARRFATSATALLPPPVGLFLQRVRGAVSADRGLGTNHFPLMSRLTTRPFHRLAGTRCY